MIFDTLEQASHYVACHPLLAEALDYVCNLSPATADGRYPLRGDDLFAVVASYDTEPAVDRKFEGHREYIDVQVVLAGRERMDVAPAAGLTIGDEYDSSRDLMFFQTPATFSSLTVQPGQFAVFFPQDAHRPNCAIDQAAPVKKVVVKIRATSCNFCR
ncbi:MAG: YhcH/YjgK/YiaL family protein [Pirellulales bacterium]|nr:YhcH/YjgK/YiaL family protein [Pirellulales bacterium]